MAEMNSPEYNYYWNYVKKLLKKWACMVLPIALGVDQFYLYQILWLELVYYLVMAEKYDKVFCWQEGSTPRTRAPIHLRFAWISILVPLLVYR